MRQQKSKSNSILFQVYSGLLKSCGCLLLVYGVIVLPLSGLFFTFGIKDKQVEVFVPPLVTVALKAKQSEAKQYISSMNKGQQAYFAENGTFSTSIEALGLGIKTETTNYKYSIRVTKTAAFNYGVPKKPELKSYFGGVFLVPAQELDRNADRDAKTTLTIICKINGYPDPNGEWLLFRFKQIYELEDRPLIRFKQIDEPAEPIYQNGEVICGKGTTEVSK